MDWAGRYTIRIYLKNSLTAAWHLFNMSLMFDASTPVLDNQLRRQDREGGVSPEGTVIIGTMGVGSMTKLS